MNMATRWVALLTAARGDCSGVFFNLFSVLGATSWIVHGLRFPTQLTDVVLNSPLNKIAFHVQQEFRIVYTGLGVKVNA
jgi:hypothetical protein